MIVQLTTPQQFHVLITIYLTQKNTNFVVRMKLYIYSSGKVFNIYLDLFSFLNYNQFLWF